MLDVTSMMQDLFASKMIETIWRTDGRKFIGLVLKKTRQIPMDSHTKVTGLVWYPMIGHEV